MGAFKTLLKCLGELWVPSDMGHASREEKSDSWNFYVLGLPHNISPRNDGLTIFQAPPQSNNLMGQSTEDVRALASAFAKISVSRANRKFNRRAHALAKLSLTESGESLSA
uniref:Uncharacterized protein n=1 Tax=Rhizophora mucronata TaxID=61149 RepID=A0A2P2P7X5_RHIMU